MSTCLNCNATTGNNYCPVCGQSTSVTRFSFQNLLREDVTKGIFEIEKGLFFTVAQLLSRPGHMIKEYVQGKRVKYTHYLSLLFFIIALDVLLMEFWTIRLRDVYDHPKLDEDFLDLLEKISRDYEKVFILCTIPVYALFSWALFRREKLNFAEHLVLNAYRASGELLFGLVLTIIVIFVRQPDTLRTMVNVMSVIVIGYTVILYYQYFMNPKRRRFSLFVRSLITAVSPHVVVLLLVVIYEIVQVIQK